MAFSLGVVSSDEVSVHTVTRVERLQRLAPEGLRPQRFVRHSSTWRVVEPIAFDPPALAKLSGQRAGLAPTPTLEKTWAEAVFEAVRARLLPDAPSRLDCVYAVGGGYNAAFDLMPQLSSMPSTFEPSGFPNSGPMVVPATTRGRWVAVDMHLFGVPEPLPADDAAVIGATLIALEDRAERYWRGETSQQPLTELLCEGLAVDGWGG